MRKQGLNIVIICLVVIGISLQANSQSALLRYNYDTYQRLSSLVLFNDSVHTAIKPYAVSQIGYTYKWDSAMRVKLKDPFLFYVLNYYKRPYKRFSFYVTPLLSVAQTYNNSNKQFLPDYRLGAEMVFKYKKSLTINMALYYAKTVFPDFMAKRIDSTAIIPHAGKFDVKNGNKYNYKNGFGYLSYAPSKYFNLQFGKDVTFIGDGYQSLLLSDNSAPFPFVKAIFEAWRIKYLFMVSGLKDINSDSANLKLYRKYNATHCFSLNITKNINITAFETVIYQAVDSFGNRRGVEVNYLNPAVFFRPVEFSLGSPDNVLFGGSISIRLPKQIQLYSQLILDEFIISHIKARDGWWGNKQGIQMGFKVLDFLKINGLYVQCEYNHVRPYTYSHENTIRNYGNMLQPLAHPLGANFKEMIGIFGYYHKRFSVSGMLTSAKYGTDNDTISYGQDIYKSYSKRIRRNDAETGNQILQGVLNQIFTAQLTGKYWINREINLELELSAMVREHRIAGTKTRDFFITGCIRSAIFNKKYLY